MTILDHSKSVSSSDLADAKDAIESMFQDFDATYQTVGLAVTPPVRPDDNCDTINNWSDPQDWVTAQLDDDFQSSPHVLNYNSDAVHNASCVDTPSNGELNGSHTNLGTPIKDAADELAANGRPDVTWGIILLTDGAANVAPSNTVTASHSTGDRFCTSESAVTYNSGDNNGYDKNTNDVCANDGNAAQDKNSGSGNSRDCDSSQKDRHIFYGFGADSGIPYDASIDGIEVRLDASVNALGGNNATRMLCVEVSWDGGSHWSNYQTVDFNSTNEVTYRLGGSNDTWGHNWSIYSLSGNNLRVRVTDVSNASGSDFYMDSVAVNVTYTSTETTQSSRGPCDWAMQQANAAKALGIEIYTIGWGVPWGDSCKNDDWNSPYYGMDAESFLRALATDSNHYFNQPKNSDLTEVFASIGSALTTGSRLVQ